MVLQLVLNGFLRSYSKWVILKPDAAEDDPDEERVAGYSNVGPHGLLENYKPSFKSSQWKLNGQQDIIRERVDEIRTIVRKDELNYEFKEDLSFGQAIWRNMSGESDGKNITGSNRLKYEFEFEPTLKELNQVIKKWDYEHENQVSDYQDVGFKFYGEQKTYWLSESLVSETYDLNVRFINGHVVDSASLLRQLTKKRESILSLLQGN